MCHLRDMHVGQWVFGVVAEILQDRDVQIRDLVAHALVEIGTKHHVGEASFRVNGIAQRVPEVLIILFRRVRGYDHWTAVLPFRVRPGEIRVRCGVIGPLDVEQAFPRRLLSSAESASFGVEGLCVADAEPVPELVGELTDHIDLAIRDPFWIRPGEIVWRSRGWVRIEPTHAVQVVRVDIDDDVGLRAVGQLGKTVQSEWSNSAPFWSLYSTADSQVALSPVPVDMSKAGPP